ncbi:MAG: Molybdopterin molybdenumtransferase [Pelotomaculum sp. PtaU1.Bin035]|nr:MAG: Molybdopterin molybdenumtransferase [Pelotomaculum sp. PtaU1.Bin035]
MLENVELEKAQELILSEVASLPDESLPLLRALGRVISVDIFADHDIPPYAQSAVDGYAIPAGGCSLYQVKERLLPGEMPASPLGPGHAAGVVTGGPLPDGAEAVIPQEAAGLSGESGEFVTYYEEIVPGSNVKFPGEDFRKGDLLVRRGACLRPGIASVLAAYGRNEVAVFSRPRVAILGLGPDIVSCHETPAPGRMRDSNGVLLAALAQRDGGQVTGVEAAGAGSSFQVNYSLQRLLQLSDIVLTTGGTAHGVRDQAVSIVRRSGADLLFWGLRIKPGSHSGAAVCGHKLIVSLSGNPSACAVGYYLLVAPVMRALQGLDPYPQRLSAVSADAFLKKGGPRRFLQAVAACSQEGWGVKILPGQKSSMMRPFLSDCNALIDLPEGHPPIEKSAEVPVILLNCLCAVG